MYNSPHDPRSRGKYHCQRNVLLAQKVMASHVGQMALREGVGISVWMGAWRDGKADFSERDVARWKGSHQDTVDRLALLSAKPNKFSESLTNIFHAMQEREKWLFSKFYHENDKLK